ncbi:hypothetical protein L0P88_21280 [Muricauda sp. SCSIO 64092]|uniref:HEAT repeat domain-containing protein n=1 Tax=Allomuricauda sp. SCSIO 64092 TaxID=2908842 RepID=UPI001FF6AFD7|nr:hypothetical protein [Muricauda sp. SCSIO 64092]UOY06442.1 hypothetical protein L0P88_21280 [Muricauda sp. SCSIO 64092]
MHINKLTYQILTILGIPKIHTDLLWDLTFLFLVLGGLYFVFVFFFRNKLSRLRLKTKGKRQELAPIISNFLFHSPEDPKDEQKEYVQLKIRIREYLNDRSFRKIISQILFDLQKDVAGGTRERLFKLYKQLELHHDSFQKLESWRWETVAQGILELSEMEVEESYQLIQKFINDRRSVVRKQAELATVGLRKDGIDFLLDTTRHSISEWQQLKLIETLGKIKNYRPPQFKAWLLSQNKDVVLFALRLIKHYNQKGAEASIKELVKHKNDEIKTAAIQCIVDFNFVSALGTLKKVFWKSSNMVKINILNAVASLGSAYDILFLEEVASKESSFIIVGKAQSTINTIKPETVLPSKDILKVSHDEGKKGSFSKMDEEDTENKVDAIEVTYEEVLQSPPETIEVEDIEFYDAMEIPEPKNKTQPVEPISPTFELQPIEEGYGNSIDQLLGVLPPIGEDLDSSALVKGYDSISDLEKSQLVERLEEFADERELPLLEHIAENESNSELRFKAFKAMQSIKQSVPMDKGGNLPTKGTELPLEQQSIFYALYQYASDLDSKLILLKELMDVGDEKEIPFLKGLLAISHGALLKTVRKALDKLENRILVQEVNLSDEPPEAPKEMDGNGNTERVQNEEGQKRDLEDDERIPLELLFLYEELGIKAAKKEGQDTFPFDFELSEEFFLEGSTDTQNEKKDHE